MANRSGDSQSESPTFVAHLWLEKGSRPEMSWRGRVKHVQGDRETYFGSLEEFGAFLEEISGVPALNANSGKKAETDRDEGPE